MSGWGDSPILVVSWYGYLFSSIVTIILPSRITCLIHCIIHYSSIISYKYYNYGGPVPEGGTEVDCDDSKSGLRENEIGMSD